VRLEGKPNPKDSVPQLSLSPWPSSASGTHSWRSTDHTGWMVVPVMVSPGMARRASLDSNRENPLRLIGLEDAIL
jgi:hypothetical protein